MLNLLLGFCLFMSNLGFMGSPSAQMESGVQAPISSTTEGPLGGLLVAVNDLNTNLTSQEDEETFEVNSENSKETGSADYVSNLNSIENDLNKDNSKVAYAEDESDEMAPAPVGCGPIARRCEPKRNHCCQQTAVRRCEPMARRCAPAPVSCGPVVRHCEPRPSHRCCKPMRHRCCKPKRNRCCQQAVRRCEPVARRCAPAAPVGCGPVVRRCQPTQVRRCEPVVRNYAPAAPVGCGPVVRRCQPTQVRRCEPVVRNYAPAAPVGCGPVVRRCEPSQVHRCAPVPRANDGYDLDRELESDRSESYVAPRTPHAKPVAEKEVSYNQNVKGLW
jgi:hypothetical protein